jgi:polyphosphate kinase
LYDRVEVVFPVFNSDLRQRVRHEILDTYLADTEKTRLLQPDGTYQRLAPPRAGRSGLNAQEFLIGLAEGKLRLDDRPGSPQPRPPARRKRAAAARTSTARRS